MTLWLPATTPLPPACGPTRFWLGTHRPHWLALTDVPLFVSRRTLSAYRTAPVALCPWALDSGGFSELSLNGAWTVSVRQYVREVCRWLDRPGRLVWAAAMDWMCEPSVLAKTGLTVAEHQRRTVANYLDLLAACPEAPWVPVIQGWEEDDYLRCVDLYAAAGIDLTALPRVGLGSVCRRQATGGIEELIRRLTGDGIRLHGFGVKVSGLRKVADVLYSADSLAWSFQARKEKTTLAECAHSAKSGCANCLRYALRWREQVLETIRCAASRPVQLSLF